MVAKETSQYFSCSQCFRGRRSDNPVDSQEVLGCGNMKIIFYDKFSIIL